MRIGDCGHRLRGSHVDWTRVCGAMLTYAVETGFGGGLPSPARSYFRLSGSVCCSRGGCRRDPSTAQLRRFAQEDGFLRLAPAADSGGEFGGVGGGEQLNDEDAGEDEDCAEEGAAAEGLVQEGKAGEPGEDGFEREQEDGVGGRQVLLGVALDGEGGGGAEQGGEQDGDDQARSEGGVGVLDGERKQHEDGAGGYLQGGE